MLQEAGNAHTSPSSASPCEQGWPHGDHFEGQSEGDVPADSSFPQPHGWLVCAKPSSAQPPPEPLSQRRRPLSGALRRRGAEAPPRLPRHSLPPSPGAASAGPRGRQGEPEGGSLPAGRGGGGGGGGGGERGRASPAGPPRHRAAALGCGALRPGWLSGARMLRRRQPPCPLPFVLFLLLLLVLSAPAVAFNLDEEKLTVYSGPPGSYFGYAVDFYIPEPGR